MTTSIHWWWFAAGLIAANVLMAAKPGEPGGPGEYRDFKVLKSYVGADGDYVFRAFVIDWNGQEVVAMDAGALIKARSDDTINVLISRGLPGPNQTPGVILFLARPEKRPPGGLISPTAERGVSAELRVKKVYALQGGEYRFRAYEVEWKGQDVIVFDRGTATTHGVGDTVTVLVSKRVYENGGRTHGLLDFVLGAPRRTSPFSSRR